MANDIQIGNGQILGKSITTGEPRLIKTDDNGYIIVIGQNAVSQNPMAVTQSPKASYQTMFSYTGTLTTSTSATVISSTLRTVTTGKTAYITDVVICNNTSNAAQVSINASVSAGISPIMIGHAMNTSPFDVPNIGTEPSVAAGQPITIQSLQTVGITTLTYFIAGYEQ